MANLVKSVDWPGPAGRFVLHFTSSRRAGRPDAATIKGWKFHHSNYADDSLFLLLLLCAPAGAATVRMAFGDNVPPDILVATPSGIEVDIVREALAWRGHVLQPLFARYLNGESPHRQAIVKKSVSNGNCLL